MEHVTFGLALCKSKKIARKNCAKNARIPALGYGASGVPSFPFIAKQLSGVDLAQRRRP